MSESHDASNDPAQDLASLSREALVALVLEQFEYIEELRRKNAALTHELDKLRRRVFGKRSEKMTPPTPPQGQAPAAAAPPRSARKPCKARPHGRGRLPAHLPRVPVVHDLPEDERICVGCELPMPKIGQDISEQLDVQSLLLQVLQRIRPKYACPRCQDQVIAAPLPPQAVEKCMASPNLLAYVVTSKYADHLPLNRLSGIFKRYGVHLTRSTLCDWVGATADALRPLYDRLTTDVLRSRYLRADDIRVPFLDLPKDRTSSGHLWAYLGDREHKHIVFEFTPDWKGDWPLDFLEGYRGYLQADAYKGWDAIYARSDEVLEVGCMAHARRYWFEAKDTDPDRALKALSFIRRLYDVEDEARGMPAEGRKHLRQLKAAPVVAEFRAWLDGLVGSILPKSPIGQARTYTDNQWSVLVRYLEDGEIEIDNNGAERALRPIAVGRANWLFAGNQEGGRPQERRGNLDS